jgi:polyphosphate kinase 2 (PPK2 family)
MSDPMSDSKNDGVEGNGKLKRKEYERELARLHVEFVKLQQWVVHAGLKVCIIFEGRDGAGKGGTIKAMTERVSPRIFRVVALRHRPSARSRRCTPSATFRISRPRGKS